MVSGGEILGPGKPLSSYQGAGTDSNPIFLASRRVDMNSAELEALNETAPLHAKVAMKGSTDNGDV